MTTAIVPYKVQPPAALLPTDQELGMIKSIARTANAGGSLLPMIGKQRMTEGQAAVIMLYGRELGLQPMASLAQIYVVNNKPQPSAQLLAGLMQSRDPNAGLEIIERTAERAKVRITYKGRTQEFEATMEDAKRADLLRNPTWQKYPKQMLVWTAVRTGVRLMAPDAINALPQSGVERLDQVDDDMIEGETLEVTTLDTEPTMTDEGEADIEPEAPEQCTFAGCHLPQPHAAHVAPEPVAAAIEAAAEEAEAPGCEHPKWKAVGQGKVVCTDCGVHRADVEAAAEHDAALEEEAG